MALLRNSGCALEVYLSKRGRRVDCKATKFTAQPRRDHDCYSW